MILSRKSIILNNYVKFSSSIFVEKSLRFLRIFLIVILTIISLFLLGFGLRLYWVKEIWWVGFAAFWPLPFFWFYFLFGVFLKIQFVKHFEKKSLFIAQKYLKIFLISRLSFVLLYKLKDENLNKYYKKSLEFSKKYPSIVFYGSFAESMTFLKTRKINDIDFCSNSNIPLNLGINETIIIDENQILDPNIYRKFDPQTKAEGFSFKFIPKNYQTKVGELTLPKPVYQVANKIKQLIVISNNYHLSPNLATKFQNALIDLKDIALLPLPFTKSALFQAYFDSVLQSCDFIAVLERKSILKNILQPDFDTFLKYYNEKIEFDLIKPSDFNPYNETISYPLVDLIQEFEEHSRIKKLRLAFDNDFYKFFDSVIMINSAYNSKSPLLTFNSKDDFLTFKEKIGIEKLSLKELTENIEFIYDNDYSIDIRHIYYIFVAKKFKELTENE
ncbi:hypothetical protein DR085_02420 [Mycoplasma flocculare]|uniref:hypothetical protein n=1 Tax=Mesomycoplasma flocculare TaxID=2128 RepID=UPI00136AA030|nr:hypothetical protein [Mesomycoplasma flocculare]MXR13724.1 hypothetical protein [Mesomycoplasma flocculare]